MTTPERLLEEALALSSDERAWLLDQLLDCVSDDTPPLSPAWEAELERRARDLDEGKVKTIPMSEARIRWRLPDPK